MKRLHWILLTVGMAVAVVLVWNALREPYPQVAWMTVEAPRSVVPGQTLPMRIHWQSAPAGGWVRLDFYWSDERRLHRGFLVGTNLGWVGTNAATVSVELPVLPRTNLTRIHGILYASPTRRWADRGWVVHLKEIRVAGSEALVNTELKPLHAHEPVDDPEIRPAETRWIRWLTGAAWIVVAFGLWTRHGRAHWMLIGTCLGLAVLEVFSADLVLAGALRALARGQQWYHLRREYQQAALVLGAVLTLGTVMWSARRCRSPLQRTVGIAIGIFMLVWSASLFSLHETDRILALSFGFLPLVQWTKLFAVGCAFVAVMLPGHRGGPSPDSKASGLG